MRAPALVLACWAAPTAALEPLGLADFEALVEGRTFSYQFEDGGLWGIERFQPGRRVLYYRAPKGDCLEGKWYAEGKPHAPAICFSYAASPGPHCFEFWRDGEAILYTDVGGDVAFSPMQAVTAPPGDAGFTCGEWLGS